MRDAIHLRERDDVTDCQTHRIDATLRDLRPVSRLPSGVVENRLAEWRRLLRSSTT